MPQRKTRYPTFCYWPKQGLCSFADYCAKHALKSCEFNRQDVPPMAQNRPHKPPRKTGSR